MIFNRVFSARIPETVTPLTGQSRRHLRMRAKRLKRNVDWPVERLIDRSNSFTAPNVMYRLGIDVARCKDWPVNKHPNWTTLMKIAAPQGGITESFKDAKCAALLAHIDV